MDNEKIAKELVAVAKELTARPEDQLIRKLENEIRNLKSYVSGNLIVDAIESAGKIESMAQRMQTYLK